MTFSIDQFASLPPAANPSSRPQVDNTSRRDEASGRDDYQDRDIASRRTYEDRTTTSIDNDHSNFQRHLDDEVDNRPTQDDRAAHQAESLNDSDTASKRPQDTHGNTVSQVAMTAKGPNETEPTDVTTSAHADTMGHANKGMIVKAAAGNKSEPIVEAGEAISGQVKPADMETVASPSSPDSTSAQGNPNDDQPAVSGQSEAAATLAPVGAPVGPTSTPSQPSTSETTAQDDEGPVDGASGASSETPTPHFNENAQKVEASERPGWGAEHAPRSDRGTLARELKSENANMASSTESDAGAKVASGTTSPIDVKGDAAETPTSAATPNSAAASDDETNVVEAIAPAHIIDAAEAKPNLEAPTIVAATAFGDGSPVKSETRDTTQDTKDSSAASDKSATAAIAPGSSDKSSASQQAENKSANPAAPADPQAGTTANANAVPNASPTGVAQALASGQGKMPMTGAPAAEAVGLAQAGTDKRGTRTGSKDAETPGNAGGTAKAGKAKAEGNPQSPFDPGQHKSNANSAHQSAQPQGSTTAANAQAASQSTQGTVFPAPAMPDPAAPMNNADMSLSRGNATMEVDPVTGALHLSGTGSARMSAPNLSEVTMQFSRARMVQTPAKDIAVQIAKHLSGGVNRFEIRITPPELGRIEVKLEIAESGRISAHLVADKPETLDLLQKDRATLEKALAEAGLDADESSLKFSMREGKGDNGSDFKSLEMEVADKASDEQSATHIENLAELEVSAYGFDIVRMKRLDISI